jgi:hypothetical protein
MYRLTDAEQGAFRTDFQEKEREIQRYIGVYLSGLVLVTGWVLGPESRPFLELLIGNNGYNLYAVLLLVILNVLFTSFLIYKSILIHETMQFLTSFIELQNGYSFWEMWRRSKYSASRRTRPVYTVLLGLLPLFVSGFLMYILGRVLRANPQRLIEQLNAVGSEIPTKNPEFANQLAYVVEGAWIWYVVVAVLHLVPLWFFYENVVPIGGLWRQVTRTTPEDIDQEIRMQSRIGATSGSNRLLHQGRTLGPSQGEIQPRASARVEPGAHGALPPGEVETRSTIEERSLPLLVLAAGICFGLIALKLLSGSKRDS